MVSTLTSLWFPGAYDLTFVVVVEVVLQQLAYLWTNKFHGLLTNVIRKPSVEDDDVAFEARSVGEFQAFRSEAHSYTIFDLDLGTRQQGWHLTVCIPTHKAVGDFLRSPNVDVIPTLLPTEVFPEVSMEASFEL